MNINKIYHLREVITNIRDISKHYAKQVLIYLLAYFESTLVLQKIL